MLRSQILPAVLVTLAILACSEEDPGSIAENAGSGGTAGSPIAGAGTGGSSSGSGGSTAGAGGVGGRCGIVTGGSAGSGGVGGTGGSYTAGEAGVGGSGGTATSAGSGGTGGSAGASEPAPECAGLQPNVGGIALPADFSLSEGVAHEHTLSMDRGSMIRRQLDYQTTGSDHQHQVRFTDEQLVQLTAGETVVVETEGPPLNASSGHSHTVTVHPCMAP